MRIYTYSEARQQLAKLLDYAEKEEVIIRRRDGETYSIIHKHISSSPFDVPSIKTKASTQDILDAITESRRI